MDTSMKVRRRRAIQLRLHGIRRNAGHDREMRTASKHQPKREKEEEYGIGVTARWEARHRNH